MKQAHASLRLSGALDALIAGCDGRPQWVMEALLLLGAAAAGLDVRTCEADVYGLLGKDALDARLATALRALSGQRATVVPQKYDNPMGVAPAASMGTPPPPDDWADAGIEV